MAEILLLTRGHRALVDPELYDELLERMWQAVVVNGSIYAASSRRDPLFKDSTKDYLHRVIAKAPKGVAVRFRNGDSLDCRRENLVLGKFG